jgi:hypothetical protein
MHVYFLDVILLWLVAYFRDIKQKSCEIRSWTEL